MLKDLRRPLDDKVDILLRDVISRRQHDHITVDTIRYTAAWEERYSKVLAEASGVDPRGQFLGRREGGFGCFVFDEFDLWKKVSLDALHWS